MSHVPHELAEEFPDKTDLIHEFREKLKKCSPELFTFIISPTSDEEDAIKCIDLDEVAESIAMSKEDLIQLIVDAGIQKSHLAKENMHSLTKLAKGNAASVLTQVHICV